MQILLGGALGLGVVFLHLSISVSLKIFDMVLSEIRSSMLLLIIPITSLFFRIVDRNKMQYIFRFLIFHF